MTELTIADELAMYLGGGLILLGTIVIGTIETLAGSPHAVGPDGQITHETLIDPNVRAYLILLGLIVWLVFALYKLVGPAPTSDSAEMAD